MILKHSKVETLNAGRGYEQCCHHFNCGLGQIFVLSKDLFTRGVNRENPVAGLRSSHETEATADGSWTLL
uniref:Uncharacterized protein n=1 Tax=Mus musculus TaxID=10090 RepID=Q3TZ88_MOUSE|nr:unnamed protein product [Mus musculus]